MKKRTQPEIISTIFTILAAIIFTFLITMGRIKEIKEEKIAETDTITSVIDTLK